MPQHRCRELLRLIEQGQARDSQEARSAKRQFAQARNNQQSLLNQARAERTRQENVSAKARTAVRAEPAAHHHGASGPGRTSGRAERAVRPAADGVRRYAGTFLRIADEYPVPRPRRFPRCAGQQDGRRQQPGVHRGHRAALVRAAARSQRVRARSFASTTTVTTRGRRAGRNGRSSVSARSTW